MTEQSPEDAYGDAVEFARQLERALAWQTNEAKRWRQACQDSDEPPSATLPIERDAARYRFMRDPKYYAGDGGPISKMWDAITTAGGTPEEMDAAIDAAMEHVNKQSYVKDKA